MTPLELIKQGIINKDWTSLIDGYKNLTGEDLTEQTNGIRTDKSMFSEDNPPLKNKRKYNKKQNPKIVLPTSEEIYKVQNDEQSDPFAKFRFEPKNLKTASIPSSTNELVDKPKIYAKKVNLVKKKKNEFEEMLKKDKELKKQDSKKNMKYFNSLQPKERREEVQFVKIKCFKCNKEDEIPVNLASKYTTDSNGDGVLYFCDTCAI